jgi:hypothetical protein
MYELKIPHRSSASRNLQLHFFPAGRYTSDRIVQNVTFDSDYCTVKLDFCGTFAVLQPGEANQNLFLFGAGTREPPTAVKRPSTRG